MSKNIIGIVGSLRKNSYNKALMNAFAKEAPEGATLTIVEIDDIPFFNEDVESSAFPESATILKEKIEAVDAVIIATPEYNRSISGVLKNTIDWLSRPYGKNSFNGKSVLVVGASMGPLATALAQYDLKKILAYLNAKTVAQPEFFLGSAHEKFDEDGNLTDESTRGYIQEAWKVLLSN